MVKEAKSVVKYTEGKREARRLKVDGYLCELVSHGEDWGPGTRVEADARDAFEELVNTYVGLAVARVIARRGTDRRGIPKGGYRYGGKKFLLKVANVVRDELMGQEPAEPKIDGGESDHGDVRYDGCESDESDDEDDA